MRRIILKYIYENKNWPKFEWDISVILKTLSIVRNKQGILKGKMDSLGLNLQNEALLENLSVDIIKSSEIEGETLDPIQVRSSLARQLGIDYTGAAVPDRNVDGIVEMMLDATRNYIKPFSKDRLCSWHSSLFPAGRSGMHKITVGDWRKDEKGHMQVVSGPVGREKVHYQAPTANLLEDEMEKFIVWINGSKETDDVIKSGIAHLWFVTLHPFDDGNGRIARAISDLLLTRSDDTPNRYYSMSAQINRMRKNYYDILEKTQKGGLNITEWLDWFIKCLNNALDSTEVTLNRVLFKYDFWKKKSDTVFNLRQKKMINIILDGFEGRLTTKKWSKITKCSDDTALRDINDLILKKVLIKDLPGGRSTSYSLERK